MRSRLDRSWRTAATVACAVWFVLYSSAALAVPASGALGTVTQPDGTVIQGHLFGDEYYNWNETADGYVILRGADGWWRYAMQGVTGDLEAGPERVGVDARPARLQPKLRPSAQIMADKIRTAKQSLGRVESQPLQAQPGTAPLAAVQPPPAKVEARGTVKNLVILCRFSDHTTTGVRPAAEYDALFNQIGFSADGAAGSVKDYYREVSYNSLTLNSSATAWVILPHTEAYYGADSGPTKDVQAKQMVVDAINAADAAGVNFADYDTDGDGWIDAIDIIHSGYGQEYFGAPTTYIWSHRGFLGNALAVQKDGVWISGYHTEPALRNLTGTNIVRIGVICHETGHFFGLPDLYDTDGTGSGGYGNGIGAWCLMSSGSWGADGGSYPHRPTHMCGWSKMQLGWLDPTPIHTRSGWPLARVEDTPVGYIVREGLPSAEYFLVSNRQATGFDANLLNSGGLEILHVDDANTSNNTPYNLKVTFEEADGNWSLMSSSTGSRAQAGDPWPGSLNRTAFTSATTPNTNSNPSLAGSPSSISLTSISPNGNPMTFSLQTLVPWLDVPTSDTDGSFNVTWTASVGATQYELQEATTATVTSYSDNCNSETQFRRDWLALGAVRRVVPPAESDSVYLAQFYDSSTLTWYDSFYSLKLRKRFRVTASTAISYRIKFGLNSASKDANVGYFQIRRVGDAAWTSLRKFSGGQTGSWLPRTETTTGPLSLFVGSECEVRFTAINNAGTVWIYSWPYNGFAIDDFQINNAQLSDYSWTTLNTNATSPYAITKGGSGVWSYRVRAYSGGAWQDWSNIAAIQVTLALPPAITAATVEDLGTATGSDTGLGAALPGYASERSVRIAVTTTGDVPNAIRVAESQAALNAASYVAHTPPDFDAYVLSNSDGGKDIWVQVQNGSGQSNQFNIGGVGTDIILDRAAPVSTAITAPATGAFLRGGGASTINWNPFSDANGVKANSIALAYDSTSGGSGYPNSIATGEANDGAYAWSLIPTINSVAVRVRAIAYDSAGNPGSVANAGDFTIDSTPPTVPGTPTDAGVYTSSTTVRFNWTASTDSGAGIASYDLQAGTSPGGTNVFNGNVGNVLTRTVTGANGQTLYARVRARDRAGNVGGWSGNSNGVTVDTVRPRLASLVVLDQGSVLATFNEAVVNADRTFNYSATNGLQILGVAAQSATVYRLSTALQQPGTSYTLTVGSGVKDRAGNPIDPAFASRAFSGVLSGARSWELFR